MRKRKVKKTHYILLIEHIYKRNTLKLNTFLHFNTYIYMEIEFQII